jgi:hypothetical protein
MKKLILCAPVFAMLASPGAAKKHPPTNSCNAYFIVTEQDAVTVNLPMIGLNEAQQKWYDKKGGQFPGLCLVNGNGTGGRIPLDSGNETYINSVVGKAPLYSIAWEEHKEFVPDDSGGHYAWSANGILSRWNYDLKDFVAIGPVHNENKTILSSSSTSMLKDGLKEIEGQR